jgi:hypothetical protein
MLLMYIVSYSRILSRLIVFITSYLCMVAVF